jgi:uncharacterized lipoprotein YmbA
VRRRAAVGLLLVLLTACTSPTPELFTLAAMPGAGGRIPARSVELRRIGLAGYLDRPEIVQSEADYRVHVASNQRWGEPLTGMLDRVFTEDLVERLPGTAVFAESGAISTAPDLVLEVDIQRFDADAAGAVVLLAQVAVRRADAREPAHVAAMSAALAQLADAVVAMLAHA